MNTASVHAIYPLLGLLTIGPSLASHAYSDAAHSLTDIFQEAAKSNQRSIFLSPVERLKNTILDFYESKSECGWDGYDAAPISKTSKSIATHFVEHLPSGIILPDVIPSPSGGFSFEWDRENSSLSVEIENNELIWSFINFGTEPKRKRSGIEEIRIGVLPDDLRTILQSEFLA